MYLGCGSKYWIIFNIFRFAWSQSICFEPSFSNLEILAKNIYLNNLQNNITILPIALNDKSKISELNLSDFKWGAAHSVFEKNLVGMENRLIPLCYKTLGFSIDDVSKYFNYIP